MASKREGMLRPVAPSITKSTVKSPVVIIKPAPSIVDKLVEENKEVIVIPEKLPPPKESTAVLLETPNELVEQLLSHGYTIEYRLYEGQVTTHLLAKSRAGDLLLIKLDMSKYKGQFPKLPESDILMERKSAVILVPQQTKLGILECIKHDVCGAAFVCNNSICLTEVGKRGEKGKPTSFTEENFVFKSSPNLSGGKIGRQLVAYPIVPLSKILENPNQIEDQISENAKRISDTAFDKLDQAQAELNKAIARLTTYSQNIDQLNKDAKRDLDTEIEEWTRKYKRLQGISPERLPDDSQADYYMILRTLAEKKKAREKYLNGISNAYGITSTIQSIADELKNSVDPVYNMYMGSIQS